MPLKVILYTTRRPAFFLIAEPSIANIKDLTGRIIGVQDFAGGTNAYARIILQAHALTPDRDVMFLVTGPAALKSRSPVSIALGAISALT